MRAAASVIDFVATLCDVSTRNTTDRRDEPVEITGRASARASVASSSDRKPACSSLCRELKFVRLKRSVIQTAGITSSSHNAPGAVQLIVTCRYLSSPVVTCRYLSSPDLH